jgi:hypothetical protein
MRLHERQPSSYYTRFDGNLTAILFFGLEHPCKRTLDLRQRARPRSHIGMLVDLLCHPRTRMAQDELGIARRNPEILEQRGSCVP